MLLLVFAMVLSLRKGRGLHEQTQSMSTLVFVLFLCAYIYLDES